MNEAHGMADWISETLQKVGVKDDGAEYAITVTDTAGNVAEIHFEKSEAYGGPRWIWEEGCFLDRLSLRLKHYVAGSGHGTKSLDRIATLFGAIAHGDDKHRAWLKQAIVDHMAGRPVQREVKP